MAIGALLLTVLVGVWLYFLWSRKWMYMCALKMKGPWGYPFTGIVHKLLKLEDVLYVLPKYAREYNQKTYFSWFGTMPEIYTIDPKVVEAVLQSPDHLEKALMYHAIDDAMGSGLLTSKPPKWTKHRKIVSPTFGYKVLLVFIPIFNNFGRELCGQLDKLVGSGEADVKKLALKMGLKSACVVAMGIDMQEGSSSKLIESFENFMELIVYRSQRPWLSNRTVYSWTSTYKPFMKSKTYITDFIKELINSKIKALENNSSDKNLKENENASQIFIDEAIRSHTQNELTIDDIIDESFIMVIAGYETTANTLYSTLMFLAMHPQFQERVFEEISTLYPDKEFDVTNEDFKSMVYLEMCINESMRLAPPVPLIGRNGRRELRISEAITIPAGVDITIDVFNLHRDEDVWGPTAKMFNPDHFLPSNLEDKPKSAYLPFSRGKRNCIGWQYAGMFLKVMLAHVLRKYKLSTTYPYEDLKFMTNITLRYLNTPRLEVQRR